MDYTITIKVSVTADSHEEAAKFALDDLRDETIGPWNMEASCSRGKMTVAAG